MALVAAASLYGLGKRRPPAPRAILCLGDSLTESGWSGLLMWPERLVRGGAVDEAVNEGSSGATTREVLQTWRRARRQGPYRWVAVLAGVNDLWLGKVPREESLQNLLTIWGEARADGAVVVAMTTSPYRGDRYGLWSREKQVDQDWLNESIRREARARGHRLVDVWALVQSAGDPGALAADYDGGDHVHFNQAGQARIADAVARLLE